MSFYNVIIIIIIIIIVRLTHPMGVLLVFLGFFFRPFTYCPLAFECFPSPSIDDTLLVLQFSQQSLQQSRS